MIAEDANDDPLDLIWRPSRGAAPPVRRSEPGFVVRSGGQVVWIFVKPLIASLTGVLVLVLAACRVPIPGVLPAASPASEIVSEAPSPAAAPLGNGASPGDAKGPGGFVPRGSARNFYAGAGGRLWYYMNSYYWVSSTAPREDLWIKCEVVEQFRDLRQWPDGAPVEGPEPKVTVEYWEVGPTGRSVRLDNHKDYCLLADKYTAGVITVKVTLTLGHLKVKDKRARWGAAEKAYV